MKVREEVSQVSQKQVSPQSPTGRKNIGIGLGKNLVSLTSLTRAQKYVLKIPPAISGQHGHDQTFAVAATLLHGFALNEDETWHVLCEYNERCSPPWSESDLRHKLTDAGRLTRHSKPRGHLLGKSPVHPRSAKAPPRILGRIVLPDTPPPPPPLKLDALRQSQIEKAQPLASVATSCGCQQVTAPAHAAKDWSQVRRVIIDETSTKESHNCATKFMDADTKRLIFTVEGRGQDALAAFAREMPRHGAIPSQITEIIMDMSRAFEAGAHPHFPQARQLFDHFNTSKQPCNGRSELPDAQGSIPVGLKTVRGPGSSQPKVPTVPIEKKVQHAKAPRAIGEEDLANFIPLPK